MPTIAPSHLPSCEETEFGKPRSANSGVFAFYGGAINSCNINFFYVRRALAKSYGTVTARITNLNTRKDSARFQIRTLPTPPCCASAAILYHNRRRGRNRGIRGHAAGTL